MNLQFHCWVCPPEKVYMYVQGGCSLQLLFLVAENWKQLKHPSGGEWMNAM